MSGRPVTIAGALTELLTRARRVRRDRYSPRLAFAAAGWLTGAAALDNLGVQRFGNLTGGDDTAANYSISPEAWGRGHKQNRKVKS